MFISKREREGERVGRHRDWYVGERERESSVGRSFVAVTSFPSSSSSSSSVIEPTTGQKNKKTREIHTDRRKRQTYVRHGILVEIEIGQRI